MSVQFSHPLYLLLLPPAVAWVWWLARTSDVQLGPWRRRAALAVRLVVVTALVLAVAGAQWRRPLDGMNVFYLLDRSASIPPSQLEWSRDYVNRSAAAKEKTDKAGVLVFGTDAAIESSPNAVVDLAKIEAVVNTENTDIAAALRLATAALPEHGQKRLLLVSDGNENFGDALTAVQAARQLGVTLDVLALGAARGRDVAVQRLAIPSAVKHDQPFEVKIFLNADQPQPATVRLYRNDVFLGEQKVNLAAGKNLFTFPQRLAEAGFYRYQAVIEAAGDTVPQNNRAESFVNVRGDARVLLVADSPAQNAGLAAALRQSRLEVKAVEARNFPGTLAELQSFDSIFLVNVAAGDLGLDNMRLVESAVRDFGVGLVCVGGDQAYAAGGYRGTPLEAALPVEMELDSKKVLPKGALALVVHATEYPQGNDWARKIAFAALDALGPQDEMGVILWDGKEKWLFELAVVGDKKEMGKKISGMNPGDMVGFEGPMKKAYEALKKSNANLKHMVVFSDGDPSAPSQTLLKAIADDRITISSVMIGGHVTPETMIMMAEAGRGRFYDVQSPDQLPQIFTKEAAVILKSAIFESPFQPRLVSATEPVRGIGAEEIPALLGYVATKPKGRAEVPLFTDKGDPLLAHWQYGLGRAVAFTSDAKAKWARAWMDWPKYRQFWAQTAQWSLRRADNADLTPELSVDKGEGLLGVEALDAQGNYRNFLDLRAAVVDPRGRQQTVALEQTGPGHYEVRFPMKEPGAYLVNLLDLKDGKVRGSQAVGASVNYSPEFNAAEPNFALLQRLAEAGGGRVLKPEDPKRDNPFAHDRVKTFQPQDWWDWLLKFGIVLFALDVGVRRIQPDREEWARAVAYLRRRLFFWRRVPVSVEAEESLAALLARREQVRAVQTAPAREVDVRVLKPGEITRPATVAKPVAAESKPSEEISTAPTKPAAEAPPVSTTSQLLEAKRRAQQQRKKK